MTQTSPARHRAAINRRPWIWHAVVFAFWGDLLFAICAVTAGLHEPWVVALVTVMIVIAALAIAGRHLTLQWQRIDADVRELLGR